MDDKIATLSNSSRISLIEYRPPFSAVCSVGLAPFYGELAITYQPADRLLEFESFEVWLFSLANQSMTIEDLCRLVFDTLTGALGDIPLRVNVSARTTVHAPASATIKRGEI